MLGDRYIFLVACTRKRTGYQLNKLYSIAPYVTYVGTSRVPVPHALNRSKTPYVRITLIYNSNKGNEIKCFQMDPELLRYRIARDTEPTSESANQRLSSKWFQVSTNGFQKWSVTKESTNGNGFCVHLPLNMYIPLPVPKTEN
jgi:hypothetical protein